MIFGNILGGIMTLSAAPFISEWFIPYIAILFTGFIYASLMFTAGWKDGQREAMMLKNKRVESIPKKRWIWIGLVLWAIMCIPCIILMLGICGVMNLTGEYLFAFRFMCGAVYPLMHIMSLHDVPAAEMPVIFPVICMGIYLVLTPAAAEIGYKFGCDEKTAKDFMYRS